MYKFISNLFWQKGVERREEHAGYDFVALLCVMLNKAGRKVKDWNGKVNSC